MTDAAGALVPGALVRHLELAAEGSAWLAYGNSPAIDPKVAPVAVLP